MGCLPCVLRPAPAMARAHTLALHRLGALRRCVVRTPWAASSLVPLATMLRDINLPATPRRQLVEKMSRRLAEVEPTQMPALVYQLLLLADAEGKPSVLRALNAHFERVEGDQWLLVQGTVLLHVQFAVKQDQALGGTILKQVKTGQLPLGRFSFAMLLSLARVGERFHEPVLSQLASAFREAFEHELVPDLGTPAASLECEAAADFAIDGM